MPDINTNPKFSTGNVFWGEAIAGSIAFTFMNQGFIMRYLSVKSVDEGRKAALANVVFLLPISAVVVGCAGWVGKAMLEKGAAQGQLPFELTNTYHTFTTVLWTVMHENTYVFGFIMATLLAALMSTVDTLINACAAIGVNDLYRPFVKKDHDERHYLVVARWVSGIATGVGLLLVWLFTTRQDDLFNLHYNGIMVIIPAMVTAIFLGAFWPRFNSTAAVSAIVGGSVLNILSLGPLESWIDPLARFVLAMPPDGVEPNYSLFRGLFGVTCASVIGVTVTLLTKPDPETRHRGLTVFSLDQAMAQFKGAMPNFRTGEERKVSGLPIEVAEAAGDGVVRLPRATMEELAVEEGDLVYVADQRWWLGGLRAMQALAGPASEGDGVLMNEHTQRKGSLLAGHLLSVEKIF